MVGREESIVMLNKVGKLQDNGIVGMICIKRSAASSIKGGAYAY